MTVDNLTIEQPTVFDIDKLVNLHNRHLLSNLTNEQIKEGFIRVTYDSDNFESIINDNAIVVVKDLYEIVGYYLLGHSSKSASLKYQFEALNIYAIDGIKLSELKVACGAQAILEKEFRGKDLTEKMLQKLIEQVSSKYNYLFSSITKYNSNAYKAHKKSGYVIVGEDENKYFVCLKLNK
jgi:hypothetical protein